MRTKSSTTSAIEPKDPAGNDAGFMSGVLRHAADAIAKAAAKIGPEHEQAVDMIVKCADSGGTVLVSGLGKSGHIGAKISATLASLGIPSHAVHPTEAAHGDLGRFQKKDLVICLSHSGETEEVVNLAAILRQDSLPIISITRGGSESSLSKLSDVTLEALVDHEAGDGSIPAPTTSTSVTLAIGDALALAAARRRSFTNDDFRARHPGGQLGSLLKPVIDLVRFRAGKNLPLAVESDSVAKALEDASVVARRPGALLVTSSEGTLTGIFTDSDLRRLVLDDPNGLSDPIGVVMTKSPTTLRDTATVSDAVAVFRQHRADEIPVVDAGGRPVGILDVQDLITMRLVKDDH